MLSKRAKGVLQVLSRSLAKAKVNWCVVGATAQVLHGAYRIPSRIEIETDSAGIKRIASIFKGDVVTPLFKQDPRQYFLRLQINNHPVEVFGQMKSSPIFRMLDKKRLKLFSFGKCKVPCMDVGTLYEHYIQIGKPHESAKVLELIGRKRVDIDKS